MSYFETQTSCNSRADIALSPVREVAHGEARDEHRATVARAETAAYRWETESERAQAAHASEAAAAEAHRKKAQVGIT